MTRGLYISSYSMYAMAMRDIKTKERFLSRRQFAKFWEEKPSFSGGYNFRTFKFPLLYP